ncbi:MULTISPECIES: helix-turn-helix domain-containing protein [unclassified Modestobacter]
MVTLMDSRQLTGPDAVPAAVVARLQTGMSSRVALRDPAAPVQVRLDARQLSSLPVPRSDVVGPLSVTRRGTAAVADAPPALSLYLQEHGTGRHGQGGRHRELPPGALAVTDLTSPYAFARGAAGGAGRALQIPVAQLGLPVDVVRRAAPHVADSPLYDLVRSHVERVTRESEQLTADPGWPAVAAATAELIRALIVSTAAPSAATRAVLDETLLARVRAWVARHLADPDLSAARIAGEHAISVRQLYRLCSAAGISLEQDVIDQRLEAARRELAGPGDRPIATVARSWGFGDASFFSRRFRARFGMSPREWRRASADAPGPPTPPARAARSNTRSTA